MSAKHLPKETAVKAITSSVTGDMRNSSIELLRLISMFMIVGCHFVRGDTIGEYGNWIASQPTSITKYIYMAIYMGGGWVGNVVFFTISVWFLLDRHLSIQNSFKRIWMLERELLFWSLTLLAVTWILHLTGVHDTSGLLSISTQSILPLSLNLWWYPTSYALFLLFLPYLSRGLHSLGERMHRILALSVLIIWGFAGIIPQIQFNLTAPSVFVFLYLFILISYYKWYMREFSTRTCAWAVIAAFVFNSVYWLLASLLNQYTGHYTKLQNFPFDHWMLPEVIIGFALFIIFSREKFHSKFINTLASFAFGIYLIHTYPGIRALIFSTLPVTKAFLSSAPVVTGLVYMLIIYFACLLLDLCRQGLFSLTLDRKKGRRFDNVYGYISAQLTAFSDYRGTDTMKSTKSSLK